MPSFAIPESGVSLESSRVNSSKGGRAMQDVFALSLTDSMIEDMIRCVQDGKPIQLSLGKNPNISYDDQIQNFSTSVDPFTHDLYHTTTSIDENFKSSSMSARPPLKKVVKPSKYVGLLNFGLSPVAEKVWAAKRAVIAEEAAARKAQAAGGADAAIAALQNSLASENAKKAENTTKIINGLPAPGRSNKSKLLNSKTLSSGAPRSMPSSPALSGVGSPYLGPTSVPASQIQAEDAKAARKPVIHLLAAESMTEIALRDHLPEVPKNDVKQLLLKVADLDDAVGKWSLRRNFYKELDVWSFDYDTSAERKRAIDNAVKVYDKMRLGASEPEWDRLLEKSERGTGKCLSKLQSKIAQGPIGRAPKINVQGSGSGRDSDDEAGDKATAKGEGMARSASQGPTPKNKKVSEKEAQAKRLLSKNPKPVTKPISKPAVKPATKPATKAAPKTSFTKKQTPSKVGAKVLSSEFVNESDEDDSPTPRKAAPKPSTKRAREEEAQDSSDSSIPLSKKVKKEIAPIHRISDASQSSSGTTLVSHKSNSPQKSSPLASSPPTNASDFESSGDSRSPPPKRHHKTSSVTSSVSSNGGRHLKDEVIDLARRYKSFYPKYLSLWHELASSGDGVRDLTKEADLLEMHDRLERMKKDILAGIVEN